MRIIALSALLLTPLTGYAHPGHETASFFSGLMAGTAHPVTGIDHLLTMIAMGYLASRFSPRQAMTLLLGFLTLLVAGFVSAHWNLHQISSAAMEGAISASLIASAAVIAAGRMLARNGILNFASALLITGFAFAHGHAHGNEVPVQAAISGFALGFLGASAMIMLVSYRLATRFKSLRLARA